MDGWEDEKLIKDYSLRELLRIYELEFFTLFAHNSLLIRLFSALISENKNENNEVELKHMLRETFLVQRRDLLTTSRMAAYFMFKTLREDSYKLFFEKVMRESIGRLTTKNSIAGAEIFGYLLEIIEEYKEQFPDL